MTPAPPAAGDQRAAVTAGFLGWTLDAFDFFLVVMTLTAIAREFGTSDAAIAFSIALTLAFRPVGAFIFGLLADRYGRKLPLMADLVFYSVIEVLSGLAPNYTTFLVLRALFGIGMGGEWGVGASLVMEKVPPRLRGVVSGLLQQGYAAGYLLAALCYFFVFPRWGWRPLFFIGGLPALLALFVRARVRESEVWRETRHESWSGLGRAITANVKLFLIYHRADVDDEHGLARHAGHVPHVPAARLGLHAHPARRPDRLFDGGSADGRRPLRALLRPPRPPPHHRARPGGRRGRHPPVGVRPVAAAARSRRVRDAVLRAGRLGGDPGAHHRAVARLGARLSPGLRLPVRRPARELDRVRGGAVRRAPELRLGDGALCGDGVRARRRRGEPRAGAAGRSVRQADAERPALRRAGRCRRAEPLVSSSYPRATSIPRCSQ